MIDPARWQQASAALDQLLAMPVAAHGPWLQDLAGRDPALAEQVSRLLARALADAAQAQAGELGLPTTTCTTTGPDTHTDTDSDTDTEPQPRVRAVAVPGPGPHALPSAGAFDALLARALTDSGAAAEDEPPLQPGHRLGPWALLRCIGRGGMGQVWLAERADGLYQAQAAIKLLRTDLPRSQLAARFARERAVLARLNHPRIAKLLDAGIAHGQAYLVLEHVDGQPLTTHAQAHCPTVAQRVALVLQVAQAVEHAHAQLIVHRDIKPSNVMVTADGQAKLLDFGIAGLLDDDADNGQLTRQTGRGLTLGYAAPEQVTGGPIGVAADVFSLGVMLFELLSGGLPFGRPQDGRQAVEQAVLHDEPRRLAQARQPPPLGPVDPELALGDLAAVVGKALRKAPAERYASVRAFIEDLQHWQHHRPVSVRRDDRRHLAWLWWRRNTVLAVAGSTAVLALALGLGLSLWQWQRAEQAARQSGQLSDYLTRMLASASPDAHGGQWPTVLQLLEHSRQQVDTAFADEPDTRLRLLQVLARTYRELNRFDLAVPLAEQALALAERRHGADDARTVSARLLLGQIHVTSGPWDRALHWLAPLREPVPRQFGAQSEEHLTLLHGLGHTLLRLGRVAEAEALLQQAGAVSEALYPPGRFERTAQHRQLSILYADTGRPGAALAELRKTEPFWRNPPPEHRREALVLRRNTVAMLNRLGVDEGNAQLAEALFEEITALMGPKAGLLSSLHGEMGRWRTERAEYAQALHHRDAVVEQTAPDSSAFRTRQVPDRAQRLIARCLARSAAPAVLRAEAQALAADARAVDGPLGSVRVEAWIALGRVGLLLGDHGLASEAVRRLRSVGGPQLADGHHQGSRVNQLEGELARASGDLPLSRHLLQRRLAYLAPSPDQTVPPHWSAQVSLAYTLTLMGDAQAAEATARADRLRPPGMPRPHPLDAVLAWLRARQQAGTPDAPAVQAAERGVQQAFGRTAADPLPWPLGGMFQ